VKEVEESMTEFSNFKEVISLEGFFNFSNTDLALQEVRLLNESEMSDPLLQFLERTLPSKRSKLLLGVQDKNLGILIQKQLEIKVSATEEVQEVMRGIRTHYNQFFSDLTPESISNAQLGLGHSFSRNKIMFDPNRQDKPVIQVIALIESLDKDINLFCMRLKEWYSWHFPELTKVINDNYMVTSIISLISTKEGLLEMVEQDEESIRNKLTLLIGDEQKTTELIEAAKTSMGIEINELDLINIINFTRKIKSLISLRLHMQE